MTQHKQSHRIKSHGRTSHHIALHQNRSHHHHGTAEGSFTAKTWFGHRAGRSPCAHSIGKFFLCYILLFSSETSAPGSPGNYLFMHMLSKHWSRTGELREIDLSFSGLHDPHAQRMAQVGSREGSLDVVHFGVQEFFVGVIFF